MLGNNVINNILGKKPKRDKYSFNKQDLTREQKQRVKMIMDDWGFSRAEAIEYVLNE